MRTCVAFASLLLLLLATTAHGIRLDRKLQEAINKKKMVYPTSGQASIARSANKHCGPDGRCSSSGTMKKNPPTHAESGAAKKHMQSPTGNDGQHKAEAAPSHGSDYQEETTYPDVMDIAGMDYSPATRRSPIHN